MMDLLRLGVHCCRISRRHTAFGSWRSKIAQLITGPTA